SPLFDLDRRLLVRSVGERTLDDFQFRGREIEHRYGAADRKAESIDLFLLIRGEFGRLGCCRFRSGLGGGTRTRRRRGTPRRLWSGRLSRSRRFGRRLRSRRRLGQENHWHKKKKRTHHYQASIPVTARRIKSIHTNGNSVDRSSPWRSPVAPFS